MRFSVICLFLTVVVVGFVYSTAQECGEGDTKKEDCNTCTCTKQGLWACTRKFCIKSKREALAARFHGDLLREKRDAHVAEDLKDTPCAPNDFFTIDCNTCYCKTDNSGYLCTENTCIGKEVYASDYSTSTELIISEDERVLITNEGAKKIKTVKGRVRSDDEADVANDLGASRMPKMSLNDTIEFLSATKKIEVDEGSSVNVTPNFLTVLLTGFKPTDAEEGPTSSVTPDN